MNITELTGTEFIGFNHGDRKAVIVHTPKGYCAITNVPRELAGVCNGVVGPEIYLDIKTLIINAKSNTGTPVMGLRQFESQKEMFNWLTDSE